MIFPYSFLLSLTAVGSSSILEDGTFEDVSRYNSGGFSDYFPRPAYQDAAIADYLQVLDGAYEGMYNPAGRASESAARHSPVPTIVMILCFPHSSRCLGTRVSADSSRTR